MYQRHLERERGREGEREEDEEEEEEERGKKRDSFFDLRPSSFLSRWRRSSSTLASARSLAW
jgi:hypothetical protein